MECRLELPPQVLSIFRSDPERYDGSDIAEHGVPYLIVKMVYILVREHPIQAVFTTFTKNICE